MKFEDEFKKELNKISPTEEQCERIRSGVAKKLAESAPVKKKKPLYLRIAAVSGASICAAAVLIVVIFGTRGGVNSINNIAGNDAVAPSANKGSSTAGINTEGSSGDQGSPTKSDDVTGASYSSTSTHNAQGYPSATGSSQIQSPSVGEPSGGISDSGDGKSSDTSEPTTSGGENPSGTSSGSDTDPGVAGGGDEPATGGGDGLQDPDEPAPTGGGGDEPPLGAGGGEGLEIPDGYVALTFSEGGRICYVTIETGGTCRTYRSVEDASAPPLSEDKAFKVLSKAGSDFLAQFENNKMFVYYMDGRVYNVYTVVL